MAEHGGRHRRLVLVPSPLQGHMTPMLQLGSYLHSKGFPITIAHSEFNRPDPSKHPDFVFLPLPDNLTGADASAGFIDFLQALNDNCRPHLQEHLIQMMKEGSEKESIIVIHDNLMFFAGSVAGDLGAPSLILRTGSAAFSPAYKLIPKLHQEGRFPIKDSLLQEIIPGLHPFRYKDIPFIDLPIQQILQLIDLIRPKNPPSAFIWNTIEFLEQSSLTQIRHDYKVPIFTIGPIHKLSPTPSTSFLQEDTNCISWLDKHQPKSVIYVSFGSLVTIDEKVAVEIARGLANSEQSFLWAVRPALVRGFEWTEFLQKGFMDEIKERGLIVKWAPQKEVLAHFAVGGFWSHCGWNSTLESVCEGIPMLCQPFNTDQKLNARYVSYVWKMGIEVVVERGEIEGAIKKILVSKEGKEMKEKAMEIQEKVKVALNHSGSSRKCLEDLVEFILSL